MANQSTTRAWVLLLMLPCLQVLLIPEAQGQSFYAVKLDGVDDRLEIQSSASYYAPPAFTWELWFNGEELPNSSSARSQSLFKFVDAAMNEDVVLAWGCIHCSEPLTELSFQVDGLGLSPALDNAPIGFTPAGEWKSNTWYHVAAVRNYSTDSIKLYLDGVLVAGKQLIRDPIPRPLCTTSDIGASYWDCGGHNAFFKGMITDIRIWNTARTPHEIQSNMYRTFNGNENGLVALWTMNEGTGPIAGDATTGQHHATLLNGASWVPSALVPPTPPLPPSGLTASAVSPSKVQLSWTDNSNNETQFIIERMIGQNTWEEVGAAPMNSPGSIIGGLQPSTAHTFRIKAMNPFYSSPYSNSADATTLAFHPPTELVATSLSFESVLLQWKDNTEYETHYLIEHKTATDPWYARDTVPGGTTSFVVGQLKAATEYSFRVKALEDAVGSAYSNIAQARTKIFLMAPINLAARVLSQTEVQLDWEDRSVDESGFEIEWQLQGEAWEVAHTTKENVVTHIFTRLLPDTTYSFRVRAVGQDAASAWSNEVTVGTFTTPLSPINLIAAAMDHHAVRLHWERASTNEMSFEIERRIGGGEWAFARMAGRGSQSVVDDGLEARTTYWYRIRALNSMGASGWSTEDSATTYSLPLPGMPFGLNATATGTTTIELTWIMPSPSYESGFEIQESRTNNPADFITVAVDAPAGTRKYVRRNLLPATTYYYRMAAVNASGLSDWSKIVSATTLQPNVDLPGDPFALKAAALSTTEIRVTWDMPSPSKENGFELEQSLTGNAGDFVRLDPNPAQGVRDYTITGLQPNTPYWYRLRAFNSYGFSQYSNIATATTRRVPLSSQLSDAMQAKESLYPGLENLIGAGDAEISALRTLFGDYPRGYDEAPARTLISSWQSTYPSSQLRAAEALERYTFFEQALGSGFKDAQFSPPVEGAWEISREASGAPGMLTKNACALALAWKAQRSAMGNEHPYVNAAMEDLLLPVTDGALTLLALMGANDGRAISSFAEDAMREKGEVTGLDSRSLLSVLNYWQERMAGKSYLPATQPAIATFADKCAQLDIGDTRQSAIAKRDGFVLAVRDRTAQLKTDYAPYSGVCTGLDAAFAIGQAPTPKAEIFLQRLTQLRPRLVDGMYKAITDANIPIGRFLYLTSTSDIPGLDPLPFSLMNAGNAIYHPEIGGAPGIAPPHSDDSDQSAGLQRVALGRTMSASTDPAIESDSAALVVLREKVVAADAAYAAAQFDALRASGGGMTAAVTRAERPLFGIAPAEMYQQTTLREHYYGTLARSTLLKTRRSVLSVSLADYALAPTAQKQAALVAEIDSILGPLDGVLAGLEDLKSGQAGSLITLPVLSLGDADLVRNEAAGPTKFRLRFAVANVGGAAAAQPQAAITLLTAGVTASGATAFTFGDLAVAASAGDSIELDIPANIPAIGISATLQSGGRMFTDRRTLAVPQSTTTVGAETRLPVSILLHQNHPNPFRPVTTISFTLPHENTVALIVTDLLGREVARLVDGERRGAGTHSVAFDARELPSGLYLYRLEAMGMVLSRKMVLLR